MKINWQLNIYFSLVFLVSTGEEMRFQWDRILAMQCSIPCVTLIIDDWLLTVTFTQYHCSVVLFMFYSTRNSSDTKYIWTHQAVSATLTQLTSPLLSLLLFEITSMERISDNISSALTSNLLEKLIMVKLDWNM